MKVKLPLNQSRKVIPEGEDKILLRYEFLREASISKEPLAKICQKYGYSRASFYLLKKKFQENGWKGLEDKKPGPRGPFKRTKEIEEKIIREKFKDRKKSIEEISQKLKEEGIEISPRTCARVLAEQGLLRKKKRRKKNKLEDLGN